MNEFDNIWSSAKELMKIVVENAKIKKEARRLRRNELARKRRKNKPKAVKPVEPKFDFIEEEPTSCSCHSCKMPPCSWCELGGDPEE